LLGHPKSHRNVKPIEDSPACELAALDGLDEFAGAVADFALRLPNLDETGLFDGCVVRREREIVSAGGSDDHAVGGITVEGGGQIIDFDKLYRS
jgi:hypothetical protein